jgi:hypothetical protein
VRSMHGSHNAGHSGVVSAGRAPHARQRREMLLLLGILRIVYWRRGTNALTTTHEPSFLRDFKTKSDRFAQKSDVASYPRGGPTVRRRWPMPRPAAAVGLAGDQREEAPVGASWANTGWVCQ